MHISFSDEISKCISLTIIIVNHAGELTITYLDDVTLVEFKQPRTWCHAIGTIEERMAFSLTLANENQEHQRRDAGRLYVRSNFRRQLYTAWSATEQGYNALEAQWTDLTRSIERL